MTDQEVMNAFDELLERYDGSKEHFIGLLFSSGFATAHELSLQGKQGIVRGVKNQIKIFTTLNPGTSEN